MKKRFKKELSQSLFLIAVEAILFLIVAYLVFSYRSSPEYLSRQLDNYFRHVQSGEYIRHSDSDHQKGVKERAGY